MTTGQTDGLAGLGLDALVAQRVMGITQIHYPGYSKDGEKTPYYVPAGSSWQTNAMDSRPLPKYSTDISAAWQVVEKLWEREWGVRIGRTKPYEQGAEADASQWRVDVWTDEGHIFMTNETAPEAICRAAVQAVSE